VIVYMVDTLLASRIGALGSSVPEVSPVMDFLVGRGLAFVRGTSTSSWTKPAVASLMTGVYPQTHRVGTRNYTDRLSSRAPVLQERFREAGFRALSASASPLGSTLSGLERGFDLAHTPARWEDELGPLGHPNARQLQEALLSFIDEDPSQPIFAYLHTLDVHEHHRPMFAEGGSDDTPYDRAVRQQDSALGQLIREHRARGREMILVLVSDHGEGFGEYEIEPGHGYSLRQNQLHVPIVFYGPRWLPRGRLTEPASLVDVAPTLLDLFALAPLPHAQGRSLLPGRGDAPSAVYAERTWFLWDHQGPQLVARISADGTKLVSGRRRPSFWNLLQSPCEDQSHARPIDTDAASQLARFQREQRVAAEWWDLQYGESAPGRIDPDDIARLRSLGYLQ
jgi:arylsulfatase A-like enzyme